MDLLGELYLSSLCATKPVQVNRHLAARHLLEWAERSDCADLCITYFLDIEAIKGRIRIVGEIEDILMDKIHQNLDKVKLVLLSRQGKLSRALFNYIQSNQLIIESELLEIAKNANDQWIRHYWINFAGLCCIKLFMKVSSAI
ncbi:hypothetical protein OHV31_04890 [Acinetobacter baumannii]|nr:hypothetical protein [Acinetobacter baumannii]